MLIQNAEHKKLWTLNQISVYCLFSLWKSHTGSQEDSNYKQQTEVNSAGKYNIIRM
jgi:hypothetical protein